MFILIATISLFLFSFFIRALITKYLLPFFSIEPISLLSLFKKYLYIFFIIGIPFLILMISSMIIIGEDEDFFNNTFFNGNLFLTILYFTEAILISKIIKDKSGNKLPYKVILILIFTFFIFDTIIENFYPESDDIFIYDNNLSIENNISDIKIDS